MNNEACSGAGVACQFEYNQEDAVACMRQTARMAPVGAALRRQLRWLPLKAAPMAWCTAFVVIAVYIAIRHPWAPAGRAITVAAIGAVLGTVFGTGAVALRRRASGSRVQERLFQRAARRGLLPVQRGVFAAAIEDGWVRQWSDRTEDAIRIDAIDKVAREDGQIYIIFDDAIRMQIPERGFDSPAECDAFCDELQAGCARTASP